VAKLINRALKPQHVEVLERFCGLKMGKKCLFSASKNSKNIDDIGKKSKISSVFSLKRGHSIDKSNAN